MALLRILLIWVVGLLLSEWTYRIVQKAHTQKCLIASNELLEQETEEIDATHRHFRKSAIIHIPSLLIGTLVPVGAIRWLALIVCAFALPPVFYDFFYVNLKKATQSKHRALLALVSTINLALIAYDLSYFYFGYIQNSLVG